MNKEYLGDSVYVQEDVCGLRLTTENDDHGDPSNSIVFETETLQAFLNWCERHGFTKATK